MSRIKEGYTTETTRSSSNCTGTSNYVAPAMGWCLMKQMLCQFANPYTTGGCSSYRGCVQPIGYPGFRYPNVAPLTVTTTAFYCPKNKPKDCSCDNYEELQEEKELLQKLVSIQQELIASYEKLLRLQDSPQ